MIHNGAQQLLKGIDGMSYNAVPFHDNATWTLLFYTNCCLFMFTYCANTGLLLNFAQLFHFFLFSAGSFKTNNTRPKINTPIPKVASQRFVRLSISILSHLLPDVRTFSLIIFNIFVLFIYINVSWIN